MRVSTRTRRLLALAALAATLIAATAYVARRPACEPDRTAMKGEVQRGAGGRLLYYDGRCWTTTAQSPLDAPF